MGIPPSPAQYGWKIKAEWAPSPDVFSVGCLGRSQQAGRRAASTARASGKVAQLCTALCSELHPQISPPRDPLRGRDGDILLPLGVQDLSSSTPPLPHCFLINESIDHCHESPKCLQQVRDSCSPIFVFHLTIFLS